MAEYIKREDVIKAIELLRPSKKMPDDIVKRAANMAHDFIRTAVEAIPAADAVEVVRCNDCKWYDENTHTCELYGVKHWNGFFCADGGSSENNG